MKSKFEARLKSDDFTHEAASRKINKPIKATGLLSIVNSIGMKFAKVPAGKFQMGIPDLGNNINPPSEVPEHQIHITQDYFLSMHEVTEQQYNIIMRTAEETEEKKDFPIANLTWFQTQSFCEALSDLPTEKKAGRRYRLPTEAEWEYACRDGKSAPYRWHSRRLATDLTGEAGGIAPPLPLQPVGSFPPNKLGLFDMRGNIWEWTADWYDRDYYTRSSTKDPQGPANGYIKVVRGTDWRFTGERCRIDYPMLPPWKSSPMVGFRIVCELIEKHE